MISRIKKLLLGTFVLALLSTTWHLTLPQPLPTASLFSMEELPLSDGTQLNHKERLYLEGDNFVYTRSWILNDSREFFQISGKINFTSKHHATMTVTESRSSDNAQAYLDRLDQDIFFNSLHIQTKGATLKAKILKNDEKGLCLYFYQGGTAHCFGTTRNNDDPL